MLRCWADSHCAEPSVWQSRESTVSKRTKRPEMEANGRSQIRAEKIKARGKKRWNSPDRATNKGEIVSDFNTSQLPIHIYSLHHACLSSQLRAARVNPDRIEDGEATLLLSEFEGLLGPITADAMLHPDLGHFRAYSPKGPKKGPSETLVDRVSLA